MLEESRWRKKYPHIQPDWWENSKGQKSTAAFACLSSVFWCLWHWMNPFHPFYSGRNWKGQYQRTCCLLQNRLLVKSFIEINHVKQSEDEIYLSFFFPSQAYCCELFKISSPETYTDSTHNRCRLGDDGSNPGILLGVITFSSSPHLLHLSGSTSARSCAWNPFSRGSQMLKSTVAPPEQDLVFACGIWKTWLFAVCLTWMGA